MPSKPTHDRQAIESRQHHIEHDYIKFSGLYGRKTFRTVKRSGRSMAQLVQSLLQLAGEFPIVLHNQDLHLDSLSVSRINLKNA
jgi:hypothetical protein